jgi:hypothetical protein
MLKTVSKTVFFETFVLYLTAEMPHPQTASMQVYEKKTA